MNLLLKIKSFLFEFDLSKSFESFRSFFLLVLGIIPSILNFLDKYGLDQDHLFLGITGQTVIYFYKHLRDKGKKSPIDLIILITHLCLGGFFSLVLTSGIVQIFKVIDSYIVLWIAVCIGGFYEMILSSIIDLAYVGTRLFKKRAKKAFAVFFNLENEEDK